MIQEKSVFCRPKGKVQKPETKSDGQYCTRKVHENFTNTKGSGRDESTEIEAAQSYQEILRKITEESGNTALCCLDETELI